MAGADSSKMGKTEPHRHANKQKARQNPHVTAPLIDPPKSCTLIGQLIAGGLKLVKLING
jgi:hypothetical protein